MSTSPTRSLEKALALLKAIITADGEAPLPEIAERLELPVSTAYRLAADLEQQGLIARTGGGFFAAGQGFFSLARSVDESRILARIGRPVMRRLASRTGHTVHMGALENGMVTYLAKEAGGPAADFTREGMQLEAYCSGIGKVLLAHADAATRDAYLADGPFVPLTANTIVEPQRLANQLSDIAAQGWAMDDAEIFEQLRCLAVPIRGADDVVVAALSISTVRVRLDEADRARLLKALTMAVNDILERAAPAAAS
jgi:DNA-binding IclR family transcriptional regulator